MAKHYKYYKHYKCITEFYAAYIIHAYDICTHVCNIRVSNMRVCMYVCMYVSSYVCM